MISKNKTKTRMAASVNRELRLLSRIFRLAVSSKEAAENPCREVKILKGEQHRTRYLLPEEEGRLMATLTGQRSHLCDMVTLAINTGLRVTPPASARTTAILRWFLPSIATNLPQK